MKKLYEIAVNATANVFTVVWVEAETEEEALERAFEEAYTLGSWDIDEVDPNGEPAVMCVEETDE